MEGVQGAGMVVDVAAPTDKTLLEGLRAGDDASYELLVRTWCGPMLAVARRILGGEEDAMDCVQDAFLQVFRNIAEFEGRSSLGTWLHRIVANAALSKLRKRNRAPRELPTELLAEFDATGHRRGRQERCSSSVDDLLDRAETREFVQRQIALLPDQYRVVLVLRDIDGYDTAQAAEMLEITETALKVRLHRARAALKKLIEPLLRGDLP
jgi:RNA polymerase sigma-70 factor (ECF subfamily)